MAIPRGSVRIIGGDWRGRRIRFPAGSGVRPTPDRVRETVFNWLGDGIVGSNCLDAFAGTGVFAFEALSRGAAWVVMIESEPRLAAALDETRSLLGATNATIIRGDAMPRLQPDRAPELLCAPDAAGNARPAGGAVRGFDLILLDPPYRDAVAPLLALARALLAAGGFIYTERPAREGLPAVSGLHWHRRSRAGTVEFGLATAR